MIKKINTFFFTSVFANSNNHHSLFRIISSKRRVSFKHLFAMPKHAYVFWELFTLLVAFFLPTKCLSSCALEKLARMLKSLCITANLYKREGFALLC